MKEWYARTLPIRWSGETADISIQGRVVPAGQGPVFETRRFIVSLGRVVILRSIL
jgi:hypothetical protein